MAVNFYGLWPEASAPGSGHTALGLNAPSSKYKYTNTNTEASERTVALDTLPLASMVPPQKNQSRKRRPCLTASS